MAYCAEIPDLRRRSSVETFTALRAQQLSGDLHWMQSSTL